MRSGQRYRRMDTEDEQAWLQRRQQLEERVDGERRERDSAVEARRAWREAKDADEQQIAQLRAALARSGGCSQLVFVDS